MARIVDGPEITGQVVHKQTGQAYGPVTVAVTPKVYTDREMTVSVTSLTTDGTGVFSCYAPPGTYTFTTTAVDSQTIEPVEVLGREGGTGVATAASGVTGGSAWLTGTSYSAGAVVVQAGVNYECAVAHTSGTFATDLAAGKWIETGTNSASAVALSNATPLAAGTAASGVDLLASRDDHIHPAASFGGSPAVMASAQWTQIFAGNNVAGALGANQALWAFPFLLVNAASINGITLNVTSAGAAGSTIRLGVYASTAGLPSSLLVDWGTVTGDTIAQKTITPGTATPLLAATLYYLAFLPLSSGTIPSVSQSYSSLTNAGVLPVSLPVGTTAQNTATGACVIHSAAVTGALPSTFLPTYDQSKRSIPSIALKAA